MTEPTTERGAWLEEVRADVALAPTGPFDDDTDARACAEASDRVVDVHAPAMLRALEAVEALIKPQWRSMNYKRDDLLDDLRKAIDEARGRA